MKTQGESIDKEDKIVRVDMEGLPEDMTEPTSLKDAAGLTNPVPYMSILQLTDVAVEGKKTFKGKAGMVLGVADNEQSLEFIEGGGGGGGCNVDPITLTYSPVLPVDMGRNLNYILTLTGDCVLRFRNMIPGVVYQFLIKQDSIGGRQLTISGHYYKVSGYAQDTTAGRISKLIADKIDGKVFVSIDAYDPEGAGTINITFEDWDGTVLEEDEVEYGSIPSYQGETPTRTGYVFYGRDPALEPAEYDTTYTATYGYLITFCDYDYTTLETQVVLPGETPVYSGPTPTRTGYTFTGWNPALAPATEGTTYMAQYTVATYTVTWEDYDGTVLDTDTVAYGDTPSYSGATPTRSGYAFDGWSPAPAPITGDTTYTATYVKLKIGVYWNPTDGWISISANGTSWRTILDKNLGASQVYNIGDAFSSSNVGDFFQRGNNHGFTYGATPTVVHSQYTITTETSLSLSTYYDNQTGQWFMGGGQTPLWSSTSYDDPCNDSPYYILSCEIGRDGLSDVIDVCNNMGCNNVANALKIPLAGFFGIDGTFISDGTAKFHRRTYSSSSRKSRVDIISQSGTSNDYIYGFGCNIRPLRSNSRTPTDSWEIMFEPGMKSASEFQTAYQNSTMSADDILTELNSKPKPYYNYNGASFTLTPSGIATQKPKYDYDSLNNEWTLTRISL